jgi:cellulose synthase/poly-beta-1,6-N-acetylglucosamine synthase-like glycosyltransferase
VVTVQIALRNEEIEVVATYAVESAFALNYPAERLEIQVIDNSDRPEQYLPIKRYVEAMDCRKRGSRRPSVSFIHRDGTEGFKGRNLNIGLARARGSFFLLLDADSTVAPDTLLAVLPYFRDPKLAYAQLELHAVNEDTNVITRAAAMLARSRSLQWQVRDSQGFVGLDGHNAIVRREAIQIVNGWSEDLSEDAATAIRMRLAGFHGRYVHLASRELVPDRFPELMKQRWRWTVGTARLLRTQGAAICRCRHIPWHEKVDLLCFLFSLPVEALGFVLLFTFVPLPPGAVLAMVVLSFIPSLIAERFIVRRALARQLSVLFVFSAVLPTTTRATLQSFLPASYPFAVTGKGNVKPLPLRSLLRVHAFGLLSAGLFFSIALLLIDAPAELLTTYLGASIVMGSTMVAPFALNYSKWMIGPGDVYESRD